ncbi:MAG: hypothetical protein ACR2OJ_14550, partial [Hyphomicrobiales bacterium]
VEAKGDIDHPAMDKIRPYLVICRKHEDVWFSVTIGPESSNARWKGPVWAKSAIGEVVTEHLVIPGLDRFTFGAYDKVSQEGGARIDHIYSHIPKKIGGPPMPVTYQRLLLACNFPNGEPAMAALCAGTAKVSIAGLDEKDIPPAPAETLMESEI